MKFKKVGMVLGLRQSTKKRQYAVERCSSQVPRHISCWEEIFKMLTTNETFPFDHFLSSASQGPGVLISVSELWTTSQFVWEAHMLLYVFIARLAVKSIFKPVLFFIDIPAEHFLPSLSIRDDMLISCPLLYSLAHHWWQRLIFWPLQTWI